MDETITAIYENGVLWPLTPLALPEHAKIQIAIKPASAGGDAETHKRQVTEALAAAGLLSAPLTNLPMPLSEGERDKLARRVSAGRPLSEIIIEEREGR